MTGRGYVAEHAGGEFGAGDDAVASEVGAEERERVLTQLPQLGGIRVLLPKQFVHHGGRSMSHWLASSRLAFGRVLRLNRRPA